MISAAAPLVSPAPSTSSQAGTCHSPSITRTWSGGKDVRAGARRERAGRTRRWTSSPPRNTPVPYAVEGQHHREAVPTIQPAATRCNTNSDPGQRFCYYYAHLERYAPGLPKAGRTVARGRLVGYVGTSGNTPPGTPHLHFAIFVLDSARRWWQGQPIDPYLVFPARARP